MNDEENPNISLGPIKGIVLLGGGKLLRLILIWAKLQNFKIKVITSTRHATHVSEGLTLIDFLNDQKIKYIVVDEISDSSVYSFTRDTDNFFYLSLGAPWIFKRKLILDLFNNRLFNLHGARLPQNRGGGSFSWQIMMGNRFGYCVLHRIDEGIDTGDIVAYDEFIYPPAARVPKDYEDVYNIKNLHFIVNFIESYGKHTKMLYPIRQLEWNSTYWPRLNTELNGYIDWSLEANEIERFICAFDDPHKGASTFLNKKRVFFKSAFISTQDGCFHSYQNGLVYRVSNKWICVALKKYNLVIQKINDENDNDILSDIKVGDRFYTPHTFIDGSISRPVYTPSGLKKII